MKFVALLAIVFVAVALGETRQRVDLIVKQDCLNKPIHFTDCDLSGPGTKCKGMEPLDYRKACAEIRIVKR